MSLCCVGLASSGYVPPESSVHVCARRGPRLLVGARMVGLGGVSVGCLRFRRPRGLQWTECSSPGPGFSQGDGGTEGGAGCRAGVALGGASTSHEALKLQIGRSPNLKKVHIGAPDFSSFTQNSFKNTDVYLDRCVLCDRCVGAKFVLWVALCRVPAPLQSWFGGQAHVISEASALRCSQLWGGSRFRAVPLSRSCSREFDFPGRGASILDCMGSTRGLLVWWWLVVRQAWAGSVARDTRP